MALSVFNRGFKYCSKGKRVMTNNVGEVLETGNQRTPFEAFNLKMEEESR